MRGKKIKKIGLTFCFFLLLAISIGKTEAHLPKEKKLTYSVYRDGIPLPIGELVMERELIRTNGQPRGYHLSWRVRTVGMLSWFFPLKEVRESFVDINTLYPYKIIYYEKTDNTFQDWIVEIDQKAGRALVKDKKSKQENIRTFSPPIFDLPSLVCWLRNRNLEVEKEFSLPLLKDNYLSPNEKKIEQKVQIKVLKKEKVRISSTTYSTFLCSVVGSENIKLWFSEDEGHLPVKIEVGLEKGAFVGYLVSR